MIQTTNPVIAELNRQQLENIAANVLNAKTYAVTNLIGETVCYISSTADMVTVKKIWSNLSNLTNPDIDALLLELTERGYYSEYININNIKLNIV